MEVPINDFSQKPTHQFLPPQNTPAEILINEIGLEALHNEDHFAEKPKHEWGEVVLFVGTSSAGKTSIISELISQKPNMVEHGVDLAGINIPLNFLNQKHKEDMEFIQQMIEPTEMDIKYPGSMLLNYIFGTEPHFKTGAALEDKERYSEVVKRLEQSLLTHIPGDKIATLMMDQILNDSKKGKSVVFDVLHVKQIAEPILNKLKEEHASKIALVYVPFQTLAERVIIRNSEAIEHRDFLNARTGLFPLVQFTKIFRPMRDEKEAFVQELTLKEVEYAIDTLYESGKNFWEKFDPKELEKRDLQEEKTKAREKMLKKFGFKEGDDPDATVKLNPDFKGYDILINTAETNKPKTEAVKDAVQQIIFKN